MKTNKKGFTLIELLATIVIMALILLMILPSITALQKNNETKPYEYYSESLEEATKIYVIKEGDDITSLGVENWEGCVDITYNDLISAGLIKKFGDENYDCSINTKVRYTKDADGKETFDYNMTCVDKKGNKVYQHTGIDNNEECTVTDKNDYTPPTCGRATGESTEWTTENRTITMTCSDESGCESVTKTFDKSTKVGYITVKDGRGNKKNCPVNVYIDKTPPTCTSSGGTGNSWTKNNITLKGTCKDDESGCVDNVTKNYTTDVNATNQSPGVVKDKAGNTTTCPANQTVKIDKTPPTNSVFKKINGDGGTGQGWSFFIKYEYYDKGSGLGNRSVTWYTNYDRDKYDVSGNWGGATNGHDEIATWGDTIRITNHTICDMVGNCRVTSGYWTR